MMHDFRSVVLFISISLLISVAISEYSEPDLTYSGLYKIFNCNSRLPARLNPEAKQLQAFLPEVWNANQALLDDITNGTNSNHGFEALFKTNSSVRIVSSTIRNMRYGGIYGPNNEVPTMICLDSTSEDPALETMFKQICVPGTTAAAIPNTTHIAFCPTFFTVIRRGLDFPISLDCPVTTSNKIQGAPHPLMHNGYPIFLAQMLQLNIEHGLIEGDLENQVQNVQDCVKLNATASVKNIANWAIYAACEFLPGSLIFFLDDVWLALLTKALAAYASCESWPTVPDDSTGA